MCTATGLTPYTASPRLSLTLPHLHRDRAYPCHICTATGLTPHTAASGLSSPWPHLHLTPATSASGPGSTLPRLRRDRARPCHICAGTGLTSDRCHRVAGAHVFEHELRHLGELDLATVAERWPEPRHRSAQVPAQMWASPGADVGESQCRWGVSPGAEGVRPGADVGESQCKCGRVPAQMGPVPA
jgi:hypothetical protein